MFILEALEHYAETDRIAIRYHDEKVSFSALNRMADAFAAYLRRTLPSDGRPVMIYGHKQSAIPACAQGRARLYSCRYDVSNRPRRADSA